MKYFYTNFFISLVFISQAFLLTACGGGSGSTDTASGVNLPSTGAGNAGNLQTIEQPPAKHLPPATTIKAVNVSDNIDTFNGKSVTAHNYQMLDNNNNVVVSVVLYTTKSTIGEIVEGIFDSIDQEYYYPSAAVEIPADMTKQFFSVGGYHSQFIQIVPWLFLDKDGFHFHITPDAVQGLDISIIFNPVTRIVSFMQVKDVGNGIPGLNTFTYQCKTC